MDVLMMAGTSGSGWMRGDQGLILAEEVVDVVEMETETGIMEIGEGVVAGIGVTPGRGTGREVGAGLTLGIGGGRGAGANLGAGETGVVARTGQGAGAEAKDETYGY